MARAIERGDLEAAGLAAKERRLLDFVETVTRRAHRVTDGEVEGLRQLGWSDEEIAETVYITALFAFFNRVADAFGLADPGYRELAGRGESAELPRRDQGDLRMEEG